MTYFVFRVVCLGGLRVGSPWNNILFAKSNFNIVCYSVIPMLYTRKIIPTMKGNFNRENLKAKKVSIKKNININ